MQVRRSLYGAKHLTNIVCTPMFYFMEPAPERKRDSAVVLHERAAEDLRFIRSTMERAASFTAVPGLGGMLMGVTAAAAAVLAARQASESGWLAVWAIELVLAVAIGAVAMRLKARRLRLPLAGEVSRRFALSFGAPLATGAILSAMLYRHGAVELLPAVWLSSYGASVVAGGTMSVLPVPLMGAGFIVLGALAATLPAWGDVWMAAGFGGLQIAAGIWIVRRHGG
jgi:hypothetical protein